MEQKTINGIKILMTRVFEEGNFWRWNITDANGREYFDGGNYITKEAAIVGLQDVLDSSK